MTELVGEVITLLREIVTAVVCCTICICITWLVVTILKLWQVKGG